MIGPRGITFIEIGAVIANLGVLSVVAVFLAGF